LYTWEPGENTRGIPQQRKRWKLDRVLQQKNGLVFPGFIQWVTLPEISRRRNTPPLHYFGGRNLAGSHPEANSSHRPPHEPLCRHPPFRASKTRTSISKASNTMDSTELTHHLSPPDDTPVQLPPLEGYSRGKRLQIRPECATAYSCRSSCKLLWWLQPQRQHLRWRRCGLGGALGRSHRREVELMEEFRWDGEVAMGRGEVDMPTRGGSPST